MHSGTRITGNGIVLIVLKNETDVSGAPHGSTRFAFIVSTKIDKRAIVRNRIRRLISESVRLFLPEISQSRDYVFIARKELIGLDQKEVEKRVVTLVKRAL
jgi:ribonuclease P protein component